MDSKEKNDEKAWITKTNKKRKRKKKKKKTKQNKKKTLDFKEKTKIDKRPYFDNTYTDTLQLIYGYIRHDNIHKIPDDIAQIVRIYASNITSKSMELITATHLFASIIADFMNHPKNKCEFVQNENELNILQYLFVRGGACRDSLLSRNIKDIDIVLNIHELSQQYLYHLTKYHSKIENKASNCIFWRHYLNKYKKEEKNDKFPTHYFYGADPETIKDKNVIKILEFERLIVDCDYLLNAKFIAKILDKTTKIKRKSCITTKVHGGYHWKTDIWNHDHNGLNISKADFDIVDQLGWHTYGAIQSLEQYRSSMGDDTVNGALLEIEKYHQEKKESDMDENVILIPVYPFPTTLMFYDFTVNCMHIDLQNVLINHNPSICNLYNIDFCWENKIVYKQYNNVSINYYNKIAFNDLKNKTLKAPDLNVITPCSAKYYFWRVVKIAQKFIHQLLDQQNETWTLDEEYLNKTIKHYKSWFNAAFIKRRNYVVFLTKCFKGLHDGFIGNLNDRFLVFRYIKFEGFFVAKMKKYPQLIKYLERHINDNMPQKYRKGIVDCFKTFGYPPLNNIDLQNKLWYEK